MSKGNEDLPEGWEYSTIAEVCKLLTDGNWIESKDQSACGIRLVQTGNVGIGQFKNRREKARFISEDTFARLKCFEIFENDCLVSRLPDPVGRACIIPKTGDRMITAVDCSILRFKSDVINSEFFTYFSQSSKYLSMVNTKCSGATRKRISRKNLGTIQIPLPPLSEQRRIVAVLDECFAYIDKAIANTEQNLTNARHLFESHLNQIFTQKGKRWEEKPISDVCLSIVDCLNRTAPKIEGPSKYKMIRTTNIRNGLLNLEKVKYVSKEIFEKWTRRQVPEKGDVLLTREAPLGEVAMIDTDDRVFLGQRIVSYRPNPDWVSSQFLFFALRSRGMQGQIHSFASGSTVQHMRVPDTKVLQVSLPNIAMQRKITTNLVRTLQKTQRLEASYRRKLAALAELKQSLLQKAFAGELTATLAPTTPEFAALSMAVSNDNHEKDGGGYYGHTKAQKILQLMECIGGIDMGREPLKDVAGPNDFPHMLKAEDWARANQFFDFRKRKDGNYDFIKLARYDEMLATARKTLAPWQDRLEVIYELLVPMNTEQAEIFATVYAAWNNLLYDKLEAGDQAILHEARENWHPDKLKKDIQLFRDAIKLIRAKGLEPDGTAKPVRAKGYVEEQGGLF